MRKKFLTGVTAVSAAIAICAACGVVSAEAATLDKSKITVDSYNQKIYVDVSSNSGNTGGTTDPGSPDDNEDNQEPEGKAGDAGDDTGDTGDSENKDDTTGSTATDHQILFGVSSVSKDKKIKTASWEVHDIEAADDNVVVIDISNLNTQKENYMQIKGDVSRDPITIYIPKTDNKVKMKFNPVSSKVENKNGSTESAGYTYEYRTQYGMWEEYGTYAKSISLNMYQEKGAKLYFRQSAGESLQLNDSGVKAVTELKDADGETLKDAVQVGSLPGKEIKVSVPKRANAPKATVNYVKQTITIPAGSEYRINDSTGLAKSWTDAAAKTTFGGSGTAIDEKIFKGGSLEVRKKATTTKAASKTYQVAFNAKETLTTTYKDDNATVDGQKADDVVKASYKEGTDRQKTKTLEINNTSSTDNYEVIVSATQPKVGDKGAKAVKKGKTIKIKNPTADAFVWIHKVGDNKKAIWSTDYVKMGKVVLPAGSGTEDPTKPEEPTDQELLQSLADEYVKETVELASAVRNDIINFLQDGKTISSWYQSADYTLSSGKSVTGVTVSVENLSDEDNFVILDSETITDEATPISVNKKISGQISATFTVKFTKTDCTDVTKTVTVNIGSQNS